MRDLNMKNIVEDIGKFRDDPKFKELSAQERTFFNDVYYKFSDSLKKPIPPKSRRIYEHSDTPIKPVPPPTRDYYESSTSRTNSHITSSKCPNPLEIIVVLAMALVMILSILLILANVT